jgi:hypothetical protein
MPQQIIDSALANQLTSTRTERDAAEKRLRDNQLLVDSLQKSRLELRKQGAAEALLKAKEGELADAKKQRDDLLSSRNRLDQSVRERIEQALRRQQPERSIGELSSQLPIAMLPVRLETRFFQGDQELRIRIYPDDVHVNSHQLALTERELDLGKAYWGQRLAGHDNLASLAQQVGGPRARWIVRSLTPTNYDAASGTLSNGAAQYPTPELRASNDFRPARAVALPERWVAIGLREDAVHGYSSPLFTCWSEGTVPDALNLAPSFDSSTQRDAKPDEAPLDNEIAWLSSFEAAKRMGMTITVKDSDLKEGKLRDGIDLLLVVGVDWTLSPEQSARSLSELLTAHQFSTGLSFLAQGTPTNNTGSTRAGASVAAAKRELPLEQTAHGRLASALGLPAGHALAELDGAELSEQRTCSLLIDAIWASTLGHYLSDRIAPYATPRLVTLTRDHATQYLQPFGPYTALRVGKQPYGILPVFAEALYEPEREQGTEQGLAGLLRKLRWFFTEAIDDLPQLGKSDDPDDDLKELLQVSPVSLHARLRPFLEDEMVSSVDGLAPVASAQTTILRSLVLPHLQSYTGPMLGVARIMGMTCHKRYFPLKAPWVQPGELIPGAPLQPDYVSEIASRLQSGIGMSAAMQARADGCKSLLEGLLAQAGSKELQLATDQMLENFRARLAKETAAPVFLPTPPSVGFYQPTVRTDPAFVSLQTPKQIGAAVVPKYTGQLAMNDFVIAELIKAVIPEQPELHDLASYRQSVHALVGTPASDLDRALRGVLDCYSHRLDAWWTSLATRRLSTLREKRPDGIYLGGYGWVEKLRPQQGAADSLGYVHAPSIDHAVAAAVLRSGELSHTGEESEFLRVDLSSRRVRNALSLLDGVGKGQPLAALLGYRFERALRERGLTLMRFVLPFRRLCPYYAGQQAPTQGAAESIAARDVVDGVALAERWRKHDDLLAALPAQLAITGAERPLLIDALNELSDALDAVNDVLISEGVYQTVRGNFERAGAALSALDRQTRPPEAQVLRTPRSGQMYTQRVAVVLQSDARPAAWKGIGSEDLAAQLEPRLDAWLARLIGDPNTYQLAAEVRVGDAVQHSLSLGLSELGLSPLRLVLSSLAPNAQGPSELELGIARKLSEKTGKLSEDAELALLDGPPAGSSATGLGPLLAFLRLLNTFLSRRRALDARDLFPATDAPSPGVDIAELRARLELRAKPALATVIAQLEAATGAASAAPVRSALDAAGRLGCSGAVPLLVGDDQPSLSALHGQLDAVLSNLRESRDLLNNREASFLWPAVGDPTFQTQALEHLAGCLRHAAGEALPVLPLFSVHNGPELTASLADQQALVGQPENARAWLEQLARVRPELDALSAVLTAADLLRADDAAPLQTRVVQLPHEAGQRWAALSLPAGNPLLSVLALGEFDLSAAVSGLYCDGFSELIPSARETTGVSFHYDAPGARAPQSILLAVAPNLAADTWSLEALWKTVLHTWELSRLRAVGPKDMRALGSMLPALFVQSDTSKQYPSLDLMQLIARSAGVATGISGKVFDGQ